MTSEQKPETKISVVAKLNAGTHPKYGRIVAGKTYTIERDDFHGDLFDAAPPASEQSDEPKRRKTK